MHLPGNRISLGAAYIASIGVVGLGGSVTSLPGWIGLATVGLLPALVLARLWSPPSQTMSESIRAALR